MIIYIQILLILFAIGFPIMLHVKKARVEFSLGTSFMLGLAYERTDLLIKETVFMKHEMLFAFGPIYVKGIWLRKIGVHEAE